MKDEFLTLYKKDFDITWGSKVETFLGMVFEQSDKYIKIYLDNYVKDKFGLQPTIWSFLDSSNKMYSR